MKGKIKNWLFVSSVIFIVVTLFLLSSYFTKVYSTQLKNFMATYYYIGIIVYLFLGTIDAIGVPITNIPLIPVVNTLYGFYLGIALTVLGWFIGSLIAFSIARKYGINVVKKLISLNRLEKFQNYLQDKYYFISMIIFRIFMPHDFVNYGYGIFTKIRSRTFIIASLIGIVLSVFVYSYIETLPLIYQLTLIIVSIIIFFIVFYYYPRIIKRKSDVVKI